MTEENESDDDMIVYVLSLKRKIVFKDQVMAKQKLRASFLCQGR